MTDLIDRQAALDRIEAIKPVNPAKSEYTHGIDTGLAMAMVAIKEQPSAQPETIPIDYCDCANAMLKMWMDNVVTDGEYYRIMDKLNALWGKKDG